MNNKIRLLIENAYQPHCPNCNANFPELIDATLDDMGYPILSRFNCGSCGYGFDVRIEVKQLLGA